MALDLFLLPLYRPTAALWSRTAKKIAHDLGNEQSEQCRASKLVSGASKQANGQAGGLVHTSGFLVYLAYSAFPFSPCFSFAFVCSHFCFSLCLLVYLFFSFVCSHFFFFLHRLLSSLSLFLGLLFFFVICSHFFSFAVICSHCFPLRYVCSYPFSFTVVCSHCFSFACICSHFIWFAFGCSHFFSYANVCFFAFDCPR